MNDNQVYKVTYFDRGHPKTSGGHTLASAKQTAKRLSAKVGVHSVVIVPTKERFADAY
jgi:hypothetical protein